MPVAETNLKSKRLSGNDVPYDLLESLKREKEPKTTISENFSKGRPCTATFA